MRLILGVKRKGVRVNFIDR